MPSPTTPDPIPFGFAIPQIFPGQAIDLPLIRRVCQRAEALGFESLWTLDQVLGRAPSLEALTLLAHVAALTTRPRLGVSVIVLPERNPVPLAKALASIDVLSGGRLIVGVGLGARGREAAFGLPEGERVRRFVEGLDVMRALWREAKPTFAGSLYRLSDVAMEPKPVQRPAPPIWFGGRSDGALRRAVQHGDGWMGAGSSSTDEFRSGAQRIRQFLEEAGRDPATFAISKRVYVAIDGDRQRAERRVADWFGHLYGDPTIGPRTAVYGPAAACSARIDEVVDAGAQHILLNPMFDVEEHLEAFAGYAQGTRPR